MLHGQTEPGRRAVIEDVDGIAIEADDLGEAVDRFRDLVEGEASTRQVGLAEARQVGSDHMEAIGQERDEVAEHVARTRKAMEQQQLLGVRRTRLAIEDVKAVHVRRAIPDSGHGASPLKDLRPSGLAPGRTAQNPQRRSAIAWRTMSTTKEGEVTIGA